MYPQLLLEINTLKHVKTLLYLMVLVYFRSTNRATKQSHERPHSVTKRQTVRELRLLWAQLVTQHQTESCRYLSFSLSSSPLSAPLQGLGSRHTCQVSARQAVSSHKHSLCTLPFLSLSLLTAWPFNFLSSEPMHRIKGR